MSQKEEGENFSIEAADVIFRDNSPDLATIAGKIKNEAEATFTWLTTKLEEEQVRIIPPIWEKLKYPGEIPKDGIIIGRLDYDGPCESTAFYKLPSGEVLFVDTSEEDALLIKKDKVEIAIKSMGGFCPECPEGTLNLRQAIIKHTETLLAKIKEETAQNKNTTLSMMGLPGTTFLAEDGKIYVIPPPKMETGQAMTEAPKN